MGAIFLCFRSGGAGGCGRCGKAPQASQARPVLRTRTPLSLRDISPRSGESPHCVGRLLRGQSPREKPPLTGEVAAKQAGRAFAVRGGRLRRGQDPSLRGATNGLRTRGARDGGSPPPLQWAGVARKWMATQGPSGPFRPACAASSPKRGAFCGLSPEIIAAVKNCGGSGELPTQKWRKGRGR